jgi:hypothetical protein
MKKEDGHHLLCVTGCCAELSALGYLEKGIAPIGASRQLGCPGSA